MRPPHHTSHPRRGRRALALVAGAFAALLAAGSAASDAPGRVANPLAREQAYLETIRAPLSYGELQPVMLAMLDAGIDGEHPDLEGRIAGARRFGTGDPLFPTTPHGTATAGLIAAIPGNGFGIDGIAPNARLLVAGVSSAANGARFDAAAVDAAIRWAADKGARVLSLSLGAPLPHAGEREAIEYAVAKGVLVVAAAGNCWEGARACPQVTTGVWPAWFPHVLTVGATDGDLGPAEFSVPSARWVDLAAPGTLITTLWPIRNNPYAATPACPFSGTTACYWADAAQRRPWGPTGTSYAAPMVAAAAAILIGADPRLQPGQVMRLLEDTARPLGHDPNRQAGAGTLDVEAALARVRAGRIPPPDYGEPNEQPDRTMALPRSRRLHATVDWFDDPSDGYRVSLRRGRPLAIRTAGRVRGTVRVEFRGRTLASGRIGDTLRLRAPGGGAARIVVVAAERARGAYRLGVSS